MEQNRKEELKKKIDEAREEVMKLQAEAQQLDEDDLEEVAGGSSWCCSKDALQDSP